MKTVSVEETDFFDDYKRLKMGQKLHEDYENLMDKLETELDAHTITITKTSAEELERIFIAKGCSSLVSFIEGARYVERKLGLWDD